MRRNAKFITTSPEIITNIAEVSKMNFNMLVKLVPWLAEHEKTQRKFRNAVLFRLSNIETLVTESFGAQLAQMAKAWPLNTLNEEQLKKYHQGMDERVSIASNQLGENGQV